MVVTPTIVIKKREDAPTATADYRTFSRHLRELIHRQMDDYMRRRQARREERRRLLSHRYQQSSHRPLESEQSSMPSLRSSGSSSECDHLDAFLHNDPIRHNRAQLIARRLSRALAKLDQRLRDIMGAWQLDRNSALYRTLVRLKRAVRLMRLPLYAGMTLVGVYTSIGHLLAAQETGALIFSATLYHLLNGSSTLGLITMS